MNHANNANHAAKPIKPARAPRTGAAANDATSAAARATKASSKNIARPVRPVRATRPPKATSPARRLILRARSVMADRGVRSVSALQRSLAAIGVAISVPQLIRVVDGDAKHLNKDVIEGMLTVFGCGLTELFQVV